MEQQELMTLLLDSWNESVVFVDTNHIIQYINAPARMHYAKWGNIIGKSIFNCHNSDSCQIIRDCFTRLQNGEEEILFADNEKHRVYMRAVRDNKSKLVGYYERYEPPVATEKQVKPDLHR